MDQGKEEENIKYPEIAEEIKERVKRDQEMRNKVQPKAIQGDWSEWDENVDAENTARMQEIVEEIGWPTISKVGKKASFGAWLLVQHADESVDFQKLCLGLMKSLSEGEVLPENIAYLEDRVRVNTGRPQLYGTQFYTNEAGVFGPRPIEDSEHINERRAEIGLNTIEEYAQGFKNKPEK